MLYVATVLESCGFVQTVRVYFLHKTKRHIVYTGIQRKPMSVEGNREHLSFFRFHHDICSVCTTTVESNLIDGTAQNTMWSAAACFLCCVMMLSGAVDAKTGYEVENSEHGC